MIQMRLNCMWKYYVTFLFMLHFFVFYGYAYHMLNLCNMQKCSVVTTYKIFPNFRVMAVLFWYNWNYFIPKIMSILLILFVCSFFFFTVVFSSHWKKSFYLLILRENFPCSSLLMLLPCYIIRKSLPWNLIAHRHTQKCSKSSVTSACRGQRLRDWNAKTGPLMTALD